jgi:hypothetical protein
MTKSGSRTRHLLSGLHLLPRPQSDSVRCPLPNARTRQESNGGHPEAPEGSRRAMTPSTGAPIHSPGLSPSIMLDIKSISHRASICSSYRLIPRYQPVRRTTYAFGFALMLNGICRQLISQFYQFLLNQAGE